MKTKISLEELSIGQVLDMDIFNQDGQLLLRKGTLFTDDIIGSMKRRNINNVYILKEMQAPDPPEHTKVELPSKSDRSAKAKVAEVYNNALGFVESFMADIKRDKEINVGAVAETVNTFSSSIFTDTNVLDQMRKIKDKDDYLLTHSVDVSLMAIMIGKWLGYDQETVNNLGIAGILHDLGKVHIPEDILNKPARLTDQERKIMNNHPVIGYQLCQASKNLDKSIQYGVLMHHERLDGSGYPSSMSYGKILVFASILAIADTYDAITTKRVYSPKRTPYMAAEMILQEAMAGKIDIRIGKIFYDKVLSLSVGNEVLLSNQHKGVVVFMNPLKPNYPIVKVDNTVYNLEKEKEKENGLSIIDVL
ncbi:MAG: HD-GYP domain-containing protein [Syntrophomonas sp.]|nr:HD-GYP domain-containing protein [Syntrophomonas sp.]